jgi:phosphoglycolate phosphatase
MRTRPLWLFDFDGVVADSLDFFEALLKEKLSALGFDFLKTREDFLALFDSNLYDSLSKKGMSWDDLERLFVSIENGTDFSPVKLYDGILDAVVRIKAVANTAVISSNRESQIEAILENNGARGHFPRILGFCSDISKSRKIKRAMADFGAAPERTFYVADTVGDIAECREAGVVSVAVGWGWHSPAKLKERSPDHFAEDMKALVALAMGELCHT